MPPSAVPQRIILTQDNTQRVRIFGLQDDVGNFVLDAVLTATLLDVDRNQVPGLIGIGMSYVPISNGNYEGTIDNNFKPRVGSDYTLILDGDGDGGASHIHVEINCEIRVRSN